MFACDKTITLVQLVNNGEEDSYILTEINNVSWHSKVKIEIEDKGIRTADLAYIRIPEEELPEGTVLANGDYVVKGNVRKNITRHADLKEYEYVTIVSVGDNRRGRLRHWAVIGKK